MIHLTDLSQIKEEMDLRFYKGNAKYPRTYVISKDLFLDWINANVTVSGGSGDSIYTANGTLTGDRTITGDGNSLVFTLVSNFNVIATSDSSIATGGTITLNSGATPLIVDAGTLNFLSPGYTDPGAQVESPSAGQLLYNSSLKKFQFYNGDAWETITSSTR
jgi:hypothetical protein